MAYLFGSLNTDSIRCGTDVTHGTTWSLFARFKLTRFVNEPDRRIVYFSTANYGLANGLMQTALSSDGHNSMVIGSSVSGSYTGSFTQWGTSGFAADVIHTVVGTYDGSTFKLYADTDATAKSTAALTGSSDTTGTQEFVIGNLPNAGSQSGDATIYEVGWWPGVVLTGAEAAILGGGGPATGVPTPTHYWPLIANANDLYGSAHGTVVGATLVGHSGTNAFSATTPTRRNLTLLDVGS